MIHTYDNGVVAIDTFMHGREGITAVYYLPGERPALIETGPGSSIEVTRKGLAEAGVDHLDWIVVTHIHLDHAGAVGHLAGQFPQATVVVREEGARHLADPSRLWASAARLYPDMEKLWGEMIPVAEERIRVVSEDGPVADLGGRELHAIYAPGHAKHHMALHEPKNNDLFTGDAIGVYIPEAGRIRPATPPPEFDLEVNLQTIEKLRALGAARVFPTHFGQAPNPEAAFDEARDQYTKWVAVAEEVFNRGGDQADIAAAFQTKRQEFYPNLSSEALDKFEQTTSYQLNAAGMFRYLTKRAEAELSRSSTS